VFTKVWVIFEMCKTFTWLWVILKICEHINKGMGDLKNV